MIIHTDMRLTGVFPCSVRQSNVNNTRYVVSQITNVWYTMGRECKSVAVKTVVHNVLSEMWSVCIMASIWRKLKGYCVRSQKGKGEHCVCKKKCPQGGIR